MIIDNEGNECRTSQQKLKALQTQFLNPPQPENLTVVEKQHYDQISRLSLRQLLDNAEKAKDAAHCILDQPIKVVEVLRVVRDLKPGKAAGPDDLHNTLLKNLPNRCWAEITHIFNRCLCEGVHPRTWNTANVTPVPKPGKKLDRPSHYRPIAVSSCLGRVLEKIMADRLQTYCIARRIFTNNQCGFQPNRRTADVITILLNDARSCLDHNKPCVAVALDFSKAYDTIWHAGLLFKLSTIYGIGNTFLRWTASFLRGKDPSQQHGHLLPVAPNTVRRTAGLEH